MKRKAQGSGASGAATLVAIIAGLIILYILFLPPQERAALLDGEAGNGARPVGVQTGGYIDGNNIVIQDLKGIVFEDSPGKIDYTALGEFEHPLPPFTLFKTTDAKVLQEINPFYVKNGWFDKKSFNTTFMLTDLRNTENVMLSFVLGKHSGVLSISLNGIPIYEFEEQGVNPKPVSLRNELLKQENILEFSVSKVGAEFWKTNEYSFNEVKITGDITDRSKEKSTNTFYITKNEGENLERAYLRFLPECNIGTTGLLTIEINDRLGFQGIPDCGQMNEIELGTDIINIGKNKIEFITDKGSYLVDRIMVKTELQSTAIPVYYFELEPKLFTAFEEYPEEECGKIDGVCPSFCDEDIDIDCCFLEYDTPFWCDMMTKNKDDRCVGYVEEANCARCPSGYEDERGDSPKACEDLCGDDSDGDCPSGCSEDFDIDCCYDKSGDQYWCDDTPTTGLSYTCVNEVSRGMCDICPTGYESEDSGTVCYPEDEVWLAEALRPEVSILLTMKFTNDIDNKDAELYINGHLVHLQTRGTYYQKDISMWVEPGTNSIEIKPFSELNIRTLQIGII